MNDSSGPSANECVQITMCCGGFVVSGKVIAGQEYFEEMWKFGLRGTIELRCQSATWRGGTAHSATSSMEMGMSKRYSGALDWVREVGYRPS